MNLCNSNQFFGRRYQHEHARSDINGQQRRRQSALDLLWYCSSSSDMYCCQLSRLHASSLPPASSSTGSGSACRLIRHQVPPEMRFFDAGPYANGSPRVGMCHTITASLQPVTTTEAGLRRRVRNESIRATAIARHSCGINRPRSDTSTAGPWRTRRLRSCTHRPDMPSNSGRIAAEAMERHSSTGLLAWHLHPDMTPLSPAPPTLIRTLPPRNDPNAAVAKTRIADSHCVGW